MEDKILQIKQWFKDTEKKYDDHKVERNGLYMHDLIVENNRLFVEKVTLRKVIEILEK